MKEIVSNFNTKIENLFKDPHYYIVAWVCEIENLRGEKSWSQKENMCIYV